MTPPSIQNFKVLGLWVFFLICCSIFSFIFNMGCRLTFRYLTISLSSESSCFTTVHSSSSKNIFKHEYLTYKRPSLVQPFTYFPETSVRKTFDTGIKLYSSKPVIITNHQLWYHLLKKLREEIPERSTKMRQESNYTREWHHLQPKTLSLDPVCKYGIVNSHWFIRYIKNLSFFLRFVFSYI